MSDLKRARSRYRQVKLLVTQQRGGRLDYSVYAKGLTGGWDERTCIARGSVECEAHEVATTEDALRLVMVALSGETLPARD